MNTNTNTTVANNTTTVTSKPQEPQRPKFLPAEGYWNERIYSYYRNENSTHNKIFVGGKEILLAVEEAAELNRYIAAKTKWVFASYIAAKKRQEALANESKTR